MRKENLKDLSKCDKLQAYITDGSAAAVTEIDLSHNMLPSLSALKPFENLTQLIFDYNYLKNLSSLPRFSNLKVLSLSYNQITD